MISRALATVAVTFLLLTSMVTAQAVADPARLSAMPAQSRILDGAGPHGGEVMAIGHSPHDSRIVLAASSQGIFRSSDGGKTWERASKGLSNSLVRGFVFHPRKPNIVYTSPFGYRSRDGGKTWGFLKSLLSTRPADVPETIGITNSGKRLFFAGMVNLLASRDDGKSWDKLFSTGGLGYQACGFAMHGAGRGTLYLVTPHETRNGKTATGLFRSGDGGRSWSRRSLGRCPRRLVVSPDDRDLLFALRSDSSIGDSRIEKSHNGGRTWKVLNTGLSSVFDFAVSRSNPRVLYGLGSQASSPYGVSIIRSSNRGRTWKHVWSLPYHLGTTRGMLPLAIHPKNPDIILLGGFEGVRRSLDGGKTFVATNQGLSATVPGSVAFSRWDPSVIYSSTGQQVYRSRDGGESWGEIGGFVEARISAWRPWINDLAIDALDHVYVSYLPAATQSHDDTQIYRSVDGGDTWERASDIPALRLLAHPTAGGFLYAGTRSGVVITKDGGQTWSAAPLPALPVSDLHLDESTGSTYALMSELRSQDPTQMGLFRTDALGAQWTQLEYPPIGEGYAVAALGDAMYAVGTRGIARSSDGGRTWTLNQFVNGVGGPADITIDPLDPNRIAASSSQRGVIWSRDGGVTWDTLANSAHQRSGVVEFFPSANVVVDEVLSERPLFAGDGGIWRIVPGPNPEHEAEIEGEVRAGEEVQCESGEWRRTNTVTYKWFDGTGNQFADANEKTFRVPEPTRYVFEIYCRAIGEGPGGRYATTSSVNIIRS